LDLLGKTGVAKDPQVVDFALDQLAKINLLADSSPVAVTASPRRTAMKQLGLVAGIVVIQSILAPAAQACVSTTACATQGGDGSQDCCSFPGQVCVGPK